MTPIWSLENVRISHCVSRVFEWNRENASSVDCIVCTKQAWSRPENNTLSEWKLTWRSRLMAARPMAVHFPFAPAFAMPSSTTSAVKCMACRHSCGPPTNEASGSGTSTIIIRTLQLLQVIYCSGFAGPGFIHYMIKHPSSTTLAVKCMACRHSCGPPTNEASGPGVATTKDPSSTTSAVRYTACCHSCGSPSEKNTGGKKSQGLGTHTRQQWRRNYLETSWLLCAEGCKGLFQQRPLSCNMQRSM